MPKPIVFKLLVLGGRELLPLGKLSEHRRLGMELKPISPSREEYFQQGAFRVTPELQAFLKGFNFDDCNGIIICHHGGWGIEVTSYLPPNLGAKTLIVDRTQPPEGYPARCTLGTYGSCWDWVRTRVIWMQALAGPSRPPGTTDAPYCYNCGIQMQRAGSCFACPGCGNTSDIS